MLSDIHNRSDLSILMTHFYKSLLSDDEISFFFTDIAKIDIEKHIPHIVDFWENLLFNTCSFTGNIFEKHLQLHQISKLDKTHFDLWLKYFYNSVDTLYAGDNSEKIKTRALSIATIIQSKLYLND